MIEIDGAQGEGGGQVLRTALALSLATETPFRLVDIRANRKTPGLKPQHLASVHAAQRVGDAEVEGDVKKSRELVFRPRGIRPGEILVDVGTAGSATLVAQTVLVPLLTASGPSRVTVIGGTHNAWAPPFEFLEKTFLPVVERLGPSVVARCPRPGFAPAGGGRIEVDIEPAAALEPLDLCERGRVRARRALALISQLPRHIATRELAAVGKRLGWPRKECEIHEVSSAEGPGNALLLEIACEHVTEVFFEPGKVGVRAETVASRVIGAALAWLDAHVPVGEHLADQLLLPLALGAGGRFVTLPLSSHASTQIDLIRRFVDVEIEVEDAHPGAVEVRVTPVT